MSNLSTLVELRAFPRQRKKWGLTPIIISLVLFGVLIVLAEGSAVAPFLYAFF
jgi:hypothetical protein